MIGCDTNVLVRAVLNDEPNEAKIAALFLKKFSSEKKLFISSYALLELVWVLKVKKRTREEVLNAILNLLDAEGVTIGQREVVTLAIEMYAKGKADFGAYLILAEGMVNGASSVASFDKAFCKDNKSVKPPQRLQA